MSNTIYKFGNVHGTWEYDEWGQVKVLPRPYRISTHELRIHEHTLVDSKHEVKLLPITTSRIEEYVKNQHFLGELDKSVLTSGSDEDDIWEWLGMNIDDVEVSMENTNVGEYADEGHETLMGEFVLNGVRFFGFTMGGDWEYPLYAVFHMKRDVIEPVLYIPDVGNTYDVANQRAYGNHSEFDLEDELEHLGLDMANLDFDIPLVLEDLAAYITYWKLS
jgi:hypothetical protein